MEKQPLSASELDQLNAWWRAANYLSAGMIYLYDNPLLREPLKPEHIKKRLLGHWGSDPGQTFLWVHLNRVIRKYDLNMSSTPLSALESFDCVLIVTDHSTYDYKDIVKRAKLVVDTRNATKGIVAENLVRC